MLFQMSNHVKTNTCQHQQGDCPPDTQKMNPLPQCGNLCFRSWNGTMIRSRFFSNRNIFPFGKQDRDTGLNGIFLHLHETIHAKNLTVVDLPAAFHALHGFSSHFCLFSIVQHFSRFVKWKSKKIPLPFRKRRKMKFTNDSQNNLKITLDNHTTMW